MRACNKLGKLYNGHTKTNKQKGIKKKYSEFDIHDHFECQVDEVVNKLYALKNIDHT